LQLGTEIRNQNSRIQKIATNAAKLALKYCKSSFKNNLTSSSHVIMHHLHLVHDPHSRCHEPSSFPVCHSISFVLQQCNGLLILWQCIFVSC